VRRLSFSIATGTPLEPGDVTVFTAGREGGFSGADFAQQGWWLPQGMEAGSSATEMRES
jgi:hypothetical protein